MPVSLNGTMTQPPAPEDVLAQMIAEADAQAQQSQQQVQQAQAQAQQAQQAYQGAAQAPQEVPNDFISSLASNLASVIGGTPSYRENQQQTALQHRAELLKRRADNLQALRDVYSQKADEAQKANDLAEQEKYRTKMHALDQKFDLVSENAKRTFTAAENEKNRKAEKELAALRGPTAASQRAGDESDLNDAADSVVAGESNLTDYPIYQRPKINAIIRQSGRKITPKKVRDTLQGLSAARGVIANLKTLSENINVGGRKEQLLIGAKRAAGAATRQDDDAALYDDARKGFLATLSRATGERGVLTDQDVARARALLPRFIDNKDLAAKKITQMQDFLDQIEKRTVETYTQPNAGVGQSETATAPAPVRMVWMLAPDKKTRKQVPADKVDSFKARGATVISNGR